MTEQSNRDLILQQIQAQQRAMGLPVTQSLPDPTAVDTPDSTALDTSPRSTFSPADASPVPVPLAPPDPTAAQPAPGASSSGPESLTISRSDLNDMVQAAVRAAIASNRAPAAEQVYTEPGSPAEALDAAHAKAQAIGTVAVQLAGGVTSKAYLYKDGSLKLYTDGDGNPTNELAYPQQ